MAKAVQGHPNIRILYNATVTEIRGDETVNAVLIKDGKTGTVTPVGASAIFIAIGYEPENRMFSPPVRLDKAGYILAGEDCRTGVQGCLPPETAAQNRCVRSSRPRLTAR